MEVSNIEKFDTLVVRILADLYEQFPVPRKILAINYFDNPTVFNEHVASDVLNEDGLFLNHTLNWLKGAGYVDFQQINHDLPGGSIDVVMTAKALEALRAMPDSLDREAPIGEQMRDHGKTASSAATAALVGEFVRKALQLI